MRFLPHGSFVMRTGSTVSAACVACVVVASGPARADKFEVNYVAPAAGATLVVSAPAPTSTPLNVYILQDGKPRTAAVLGNGLYRLKAIIADGRLHPKVASHPKAKALPTEAELLVPFGETTKFVVRSHDELVSGGPFGAYTTASCATPFVFQPREGFRYHATYTRSAQSCELRVTERGLQSPDSAETLLTSLEPR
jgi:hypothetical protein